MSIDASLTCVKLVRLGASYNQTIINPPVHALEGYGSRSVCVCKLAATYLIYTLKIRCH